MAKFNVFITGGLAPVPGNDYPLMRAQDIVLDPEKEDERLSDVLNNVIQKIIILEGKKPPYIGENGNWFIDGEDSGISASGTTITVDTELNAESQNPISNSAVTEQLNDFKVNCVFVNDELILYAGDADDDNTSNQEEIANG